MSQIDLTGGSYKAKSIIAGCQRCVNLYPEKNESSAPSPYTYYPRAGNKQLIEPLGTPSRCSYRATNGELFEVIESDVYFTDSNFVRHLLGHLATQAGIVLMSDNGRDGDTVLIVDGSPNGYTIKLSSHTFAQIIDSAFYGSTRVEYMDGYFVLNRPGTTQFYLSPIHWNGTDPFDPLDIADKIGGADDLQCAGCNAGNIQLIGSLTTEIWYDSAGADFPFARVPSVFIEHGTPAPYSVVQNDVGTYMLSQDDDGGSIFLKIVGYEAIRFSTHAIEAEISTYPNLSDCLGMTFQKDGHAQVRFTFPTADKTWVWDESQQLWHEETWTDDDGLEHRHRANNCAYAYGKNLMGDWQNGALYEADYNTFVDEGPVTHPIVCRRGFPHLVKGGKRLEYAKFIANMQTGTFRQPPVGSPEPADHVVELSRTGRPTVQYEGGTGLGTRVEFHNVIGVVNVGDVTFGACYPGGSTTILAQHSGTPGGDGEYDVVAVVPLTDAVCSFMRATFAGNVMTVTDAGTNDALEVGAFVFGTGVDAGLYIDHFGTGAGGVGTYFLNAAQSTPIASPIVITTQFGWQVHATWSDVDNSVELWGCGGDGGPGDVGLARGGGGGGSGARAIRANLTLAPLSFVPFQVGLKARLNNTFWGGGTWFNGTNVDGSDPAYPEKVSARGGGNGDGTGVGLGGVGGNAGEGDTVVHGADGGNGENFGIGTTPAAGGGGAGAPGAASGTAGGPGSPTQGGDGGDADGGATPGGLGATAASDATAGADGDEAGSGGGGGSRFTAHRNGADAGKWAAGGGGAGRDAGGLGTPGAGEDGHIVIRWTAVVPPAIPVIEPKVSLRWSDNRGASWGNPLIESLGETGDYGHWPTWWQLGFAQDRVFELFWNLTGKTALMGAFVEFDIAET